MTPWTIAHQAPVHEISQARTGVVCHFLLQGIFPTQGSNWHLLHGRQILYHETPGKHLSLEEKTNNLKPPGVLVPANAGDLRDTSRGRFPEEVNGNPLQYSCPVHPIICPWGAKELS